MYTRRHPGIAGTMMESRLVPDHAAMCPGIRGRDLLQKAGRGVRPHRGRNLLRGGTTQRVAGSADTTPLAFLLARFRDRTLRSPWHRRGRSRRRILASSCTLTLNRPPMGSPSGICSGYCRASTGAPPGIAASPASVLPAVPQPVLAAGRVLSWRADGTPARAQAQSARHPTADLDGESPLTGNASGV